MEPELAVDSATCAWAGTSEAIGLHAVSKWMRGESADGERMAGRSGGCGESSRYAWRALPVGLWSTPTELASGSVAHGAASRESGLVGRCTGCIREGMRRRTGCGHRWLPGTGSFGCT